MASNRQAAGDQPHRFAHDHSDHGAAIRAERHANPDLVGAARDVVRHQPEEADRRNEDRQPAEERARLRENLLLREARLDLFALRRHLQERHVGIDPPHGVADGGGGGGRIRRRAQLEGHRRQALLPVGHVHRRGRRVAKAVVFRVADDADDSISPPPERLAEPPADRILAFELPGRLVQDGDLRRR